MKEKKSLSNLQMILKDGGNIIVDAKDYSASILQTLAATAKLVGSCITIKNAEELSLTNCQIIAKKAPQLVTFDFTK